MAFVEPGIKVQEIAPRNDWQTLTNVGPSHSFSGSVFRLRPPSQDGDSWSVRLLYGFTDVPDGALPDASLVFDKSSNLYGTSTDGGTGTGCGFQGCGAVFEVSP
jgi:hypothetical protein